MMKYFLHSLLGLLLLPWGPVAASADTVTAENKITATGELAASVHSDLVGRQSGRIGQVLVDEGDTVRRGQPLLKLEADYLELAVAAAEAELARAEAGRAEAERELERKQKLVDKESISRAVYDRVLAAAEGARAGHRLAETHLELARTRLADAVLRSPIDGVVADRRVDVGESLNPMTVPFIIVKTRPLKLLFQLPERYLAQIRKGLVVRAFFEPYPDESFLGEVHRVGAVIDSASRSLEVEALLDNEDGRLRPGLFARVEITLEGGE
jgi:membrane fusion protein (multidrug efflux system)